jgi:hypothetical protein
MTLVMRWTLALAALGLPGWQEAADKAPECPTEVFHALLPNGANRKPGDMKSRGLSGTAVGLLGWPGQIPADALREGLRTSGHRTSCFFSIDGDPYLTALFEATDEEQRRQRLERVLYVAEGLNIQVASGPEKIKTYPKLSNGPSVYERLKAQGDLPGPICLVEVEVNDGLGSPTGAGKLVVTRLRPVEGDPGFALRAVDALNEAKRLHEEALASQKDEIERLVAPLRKELMARFEEMQKQAGVRGIVGNGGENNTFPWVLTGDHSREAAYYYATWLQERELLQVNWFTRHIDGDCTTGSWHDGHSEVPPRGVAWGVAFGVEVGESYYFDKTGRLVEQHAEKIRAFQKVLPPE